MLGEEEQWFGTTAVRNNSGLEQQWFGATVQEVFLKLCVSWTYTNVLW